MDSSEKDCFAETDRLLLRRISQEDLDPLSKLFADPEVMKHSLEGPFSFERSKEILQTMLDNDKKHGFGACVVINKEMNRWMGFCGLWWEERNGKWNTDFGYRFFPGFWGKGYATESVKACLAYITKKLPDVSIYAYIELVNKASIQVAEKAGMTFVEESLYHDLPVRVYKFNQWSNKI